MLRSNDVPPRDEPLKLLLGDVDIQAITGGLAAIRLAVDERTLLPHVWITGTARVNASEVELLIDLHFPADRARRIATRMIECAYLAEQAKEDHD